MKILTLSIALTTLLMGCDGPKYDASVVKQNGNDAYLVIPEPDSNTRAEIVAGENPNLTVADLRDNTPDMADNNDEPMLMANINDGMTLINPVRLETPDNERYALLINQDPVEEAQTVQPDRVISPEQDYLSLNLPEGEHTLTLQPITVENKAVGMARQVNVTVRNSENMK